MLQATVLETRTWQKKANLKRPSQHHDVPLSAHTALMVPKLADAGTHGLRGFLLLDYKQLVEYFT
eukprot:6198354-Pleurochrysis_carterae.AAC.1